MLSIQAVPILRVWRVTPDDHIGHTRAQLVCIDAAAGPGMETNFWTVQVGMKCPAICVSAGMIQ
jgi:hypothetical protein